jgi:hypothetical protein
VHGAPENHIFHPTAAQRLGALLAQHPGDGIRDVAFPHPFLTMMPVIPAPSKDRLILSANDLKPWIWILLSFNKR